MIEIFKRFTFEAAHQLSDYPEIHGHSYSVEVRCVGDAADGYVIREEVMTAAVEQVRAKLDHRMLNPIIEVPYFGEHRALDLGAAIGADAAE